MGVGQKFDHSLITRVNQAVDIVDVIAEHLSLRRQGKEFVGLCPFHQDHKPSLYVSPAKQIFKCFACGAGGDAIKFIQMRENLSFSQAVKRLADRAGIKIETSFDKSKNEKEKNQPDPQLVAKVNHWAANVWQKNLNDEQIGKYAREYIAKRGIDAESVKNWKLGLALDSWDDISQKANQKNIKKELLTQTGLIVTKENGSSYDKFRNRLMFPILDVTKRVIGFGGRTLADDPAKYMNSPATVLFDKSNCIYGLDQARHDIVEKQKAVVVEGYTDVIMAHQFGYKNIVAALGTSFTTGHARLLKRYANQIVLVFDSDIAGTEAANRALEVCLAEKIDIKLAFLPRGMDPCDFLLKKGRQDFENIIENALDVMDYKWKRLNSNLEKSGSMADRRTAIEEFLRTVAVGLSSSYVDPLSRGLIIEKLSDTIGIKPQEVNKILERMVSSIKKNQTFVEKNKTVKNIDFGTGYYALAQREILEILLNEPVLYEKISDKISAESFNVPIFKQIAHPLFQALSQGQRPQINEMLAMIEDTDTARVLMELAETGLEKNKYGQRLEGALDALNRYNVKTMKNQLKQDLSDETEYLRKITETIKKSDKRNPGMRLSS